MQPFDKRRSAFIDFWEDRLRRCATLEYEEIKLDAKGKQIGKKFRRRVDLSKVWINRVHSNEDKADFIQIGFGDKKIHIGLVRFGHLTGGGPYVRSKSGTTVQFELKAWTARFRCEGDEFTIEASITFS